MKEEANLRTQIWNVDYGFHWVILILQILDKLGAKKAHVLSYSTSGIDLRFMISEFKGSEFVSSLSTIASPHKYTQTLLTIPNDWFLYHSSKT